VLWKELIEVQSVKTSFGFEKFTVQKSYNRFGKLGILGLLGIRKINNLRIINPPCKTDPDQVHHLTLPAIQSLPEHLLESYKNRTTDPTVVIENALCLHASLPALHAQRYLSSALPLP
jgi:hypothetical protein